MASSLSTPLFAQCDDPSEDFSEVSVSKNKQIVNKFRFTFLWDVTLSMYGQRLVNGQIAPALQSQDIYDQVETNIINQINTIDDETAEIVVIPFQEGVLVDGESIKNWRAYATDEGKRKIINKIRSSKDTFPVMARDRKRPGTDILSSLMWTTENIFDDRTDILFLLTDGGQGSGTVTTSKHDLENYLNHDWKNYSLERNVQGYYLVLTEDALKDAPHLEEDTPMTLIPDTNIKFPSPCNIKMSHSVALNVKDDYSKEGKVLVFGYEIANKASLPEGSTLRLKICNNQYIALSKQEVGFGLNTIEIPVRFLKSQDQMMREMQEETYYKIKVDFFCDSPDAEKLTTVSPQILTLKVINKSQPTATIYWE